MTQCEVTEEDVPGWGHRICKYSFERKNGRALYRWFYSLRWGPEEGELACWILLNPGTADLEGQKDPSLSQMIRNSKELGMAGLTVVNVFGWREKTPEALLKQHGESVDIVGEGNDDGIREAIAISARTVVAWGGDVRHFPERAQHVLQMLDGRDLLCLGQTKEGHPRHPLYVRRSTALVPFCPSPTPNELSPTEQV